MNATHKVQYRVHKKQPSMPIPNHNSPVHAHILFLDDPLKFIFPSVPRSSKAWKALRFVMGVLKNGNRSTKRLAYTSSVCPILEYVSACWDSCSEGQINALDRVQKNLAQFTNHTKNFDWKTLDLRRTISRLCALFKAYSGERAWKAKPTGC
jgi:hypothetical protein